MRKIQTGCIQSPEYKSYYCATHKDYELSIIIRDKVFKVKPQNMKRIFSTQNRYSDQDKWGTAYQSKCHADFKSAHRFLFGCVNSTRAFDWCMNCHS